MAECVLQSLSEMEEDQTMSIFDSDLLNEYKKDFQIWHRISQDDDYGGYSSTWTKGATFKGILTEDTSLTATVAGQDTKTQLYGIKVKRSAPVEFKTVFQDVSDKKFYQITSGETLRSPSMSAMDMKILSCQEFDPVDFEEPKEEVISNGNS